MSTRSWTGAASEVATALDALAVAAAAAVETSRQFLHVAPAEPDRVPS